MLFCNFLRRRQGNILKSLYMQIFLMFFAQHDTVVPLTLREVSDLSPSPQHTMMAQSMPDSGMSQQKILTRQY